MRRGLIAVVVASLVAVFAGRSREVDLRVACASNFAPVMERIAERFAAETGHRVTVIPGSTGKHFAQIRNGAPFDLFLAADADRPARLDGSRRTYARGRLVLWTADDSVDPEGGRILVENPGSRIAIANPELAPYGRAALETMVHLGVDPLADRVVRGENVAQAFQFVHGRQARFGFVALSQILGNDRKGRWWVVPDHLYGSVDQQAVLLSAEGPARDLYEYLARPEIVRLIEQAGYRAP